MSARTGHRNFRCRVCGLVGWSDAPMEDQAVFALESFAEDGCDAWHEAKRPGITARAWDETLTRLEAAVGGAASRRLYDVGTGDAGFLAVARERGWEVRGNDLMEAAVALARRKHGIEVDLGDLSVLEVEPVYDAVTLWCVLAHVPQPERLLADCYQLLKPGGVLFLQTPRRCSVDRAAFMALRGSRGHASRWVDRRLAGHHWILQTDASMASMLRRTGFTDIETKPRARYTLSTQTYLASLGFDGTPARAVSHTIDRLLDREVGPRIVLDAYARKPRTSAA
jgi:SAM-dependent methyltransferase